MPTDFTDPAIARHLTKRDPVLGLIIRRHGPCGLVVSGSLSPFASLVRAVMHQQLHSSAARAIEARLCALVGGTTLPTPEDIETVSDDDLRSVGLSGAKVAAIRDLAAKAKDGTIPSARSIHRLSDDAIVERCTQARGVGRWTVEMLLMSRLGRPDVLPVDDFGVRNGFRIAYGLDDLPKPRVLAEFGERWRPYRSVASWYMWRTADTDKAEAKLEKAEAKQAGAKKTLGKTKATKSKS
jgi:DNA-3-methyladenine glycosylase II